MERLGLLASATIVLLHASCAIAKEFATVSVTASAPWASDPAVEAACLLYKSRGGEAVLDFWRAWSLAPPCEALSVRCVIDTIQGAMDLPAIERISLGIALAARIEAPRVSAWSQLAHNLRSDARAAVCGRMYSDAHMAAANAAMHANDCIDSSDHVPDALNHMLPEPSSTASVRVAPVLVVYIRPHESGEGGLAASLRALAELRSRAEPPRIALRYVPGHPVRGEAAVPLNGFGATVRLKSGEYRVIDDRESEPAADADDDDDDDSPTVRR